MDIKKLLGKKIKIIRKQKNITQEQMAGKIGIETQSLSNIERGQYYPTAENLTKIIDILEVRPEELFKFEHLAPPTDLIKEINQILLKNPNKIEDIYKIIRAITDN